MFPDGIQQTETCVDLPLLKPSKSTVVPYRMVQSLGLLNSFLAVTELQLNAALHLGCLLACFRRPSFGMLELLEHVLLLVVPLHLGSGKSLGMHLAVLVERGLQGGHSLVAVGGPQLHLQPRPFAILSRYLYSFIMQTSL